jgi:hypothetical protein
MSEQLYRKIQKGKTIRYVPVVPEPEEIVTLTFTNSQCLTAAGAIGMTLLMIFERNMTKMRNGTPSLAERKIRVVKAAILDLFKGTGEPLHHDISKKICDCWDKTMRQLEEGI